MLPSGEGGAGSGRGQHLCMGRGSVSPASGLLPLAHPWGLNQTAKALDTLEDTKCLPVLGNRGRGRPA